MPVELAIVAYCAWQSRDLIVTWQISTTDRLAWLAMLIWCLPVPVSCFTSFEMKGDKRFRAILPGLALLLGIVGQLGQANTLQHVALALALGAVARQTTASVVWLFCAVCWMPLFGWLARGISPGGLIPLRLLLAASATAWMCVGFRHLRRASE